MNVTIIITCIAAYLWFNYLKSVSNSRYHKSKSDIDNLFYTESIKILRVVQHSKRLEELDVIADQLIRPFGKKYRSRIDQQLLTKTMQNLWANYHNKRVKLIFNKNTMTHV